MRRARLHPSTLAIALGAVAGLVVAAVLIGLWTWLRPAPVPIPPTPQLATRPAVTAVVTPPLPWRDVRHELMVEKPRPALQTPALPPPRYMTNAVPVQVQPGKKLVAVVLDDMGVNAPLSTRALTLQPPLTLSFLPYGEASLSLAQQAKKRGHDIMVHLPMEPSAHPEEPAANPGPDALYVADDSATITAKVQKNLKNYLPLAVGVNNHMGSRFTSDRASIRKALPLFEAAGLFYLDSLTTPNSQVHAAAQELNLTVPLLRRDVFLDHVIDRATIDQALIKLEQEAQRQGFAIAIGHPHAITIDALQKWLPTLEAKGLQLVPISYIAQQKDPLTDVTDTQH